MKLMRTEDAVGQVLCHDITQIIKGVTKDAVFRKGHVITEEDIPVLLSVGKDSIYIWEKDDTMLHENEAAEILYAMCKNKHMHPSDVKEGKIEVIADCDGLLKVDSDKLKKVNAFGQMMIASRHGNTPVKKGDKLAGTRIIPLVIEKEKMHKAAFNLAKEAGYKSAGTVEFLLDKDNNFYFMEMNTRLQVEHPVTEMVTGLDLVQWQIRIAAGAMLTITQDRVFIHGHAIECRINAENPEENFRPSCGRISRLHIPGGPSVRFDTAIYQDYSIPPFYDSMIGKLIVQARTRDYAIRKMKMALSELNILGVDHNRDLQIDILSDREFVDGTYTTDLMENREKRKKNIK